VQDQNVIGDQPFADDIFFAVVFDCAISLCQHLLRVLIQMVAQIEQELAGSQRLPARGGRALRRAATTLRAAVHVEHLFPSELINF
jgi:hypothetical protein